jgi:hypothetical protein
MTQFPENLIGAIIIAVLWIGCTFCSETRHNHGILIAFLLPLALILFPLLGLVYLLIKWISRVIFIALGRRDDHAEFMRQLQIRSGVFFWF